MSINLEFIHSEDSSPQDACNLKSENSLTVLIGCINVMCYLQLNASQHMHLKSHSPRPLHHPRRSYNVNCIVFIILLCVKVFLFGSSLGPPA